MADVAVVIEASATTLAAVAAVAALIWKPLVRRHDEKVADDLFLHGRQARPGLPTITPAGERLGDLEVGVTQANTSLATHGRQLSEHSRILSRVSNALDLIINEFRHNQGETLRDRVDLVLSEQSRVAEKLDPQDGSNPQETSP